MSKIPLKEKYNFSSGIPSLDTVLNDILPGDNVVWQLDNLDDFFPIVNPFIDYVTENKQELVYFRFAQHPRLVPDSVKAHVYELDPQMGFELFISKILSAIEKHGKGVNYIFDCLSDLVVDWYSDRMLGNFFLLTCPYLYIYDTVTYFVIQRNAHIPLAINAIHTTAQVVLDVFKSNETYYMLPIKVFERQSPTMYMLHSWEDNELKPVKKSMILSEILAQVAHPWIDCNVDRQDTWTYAFMQAQRTFDKVCQIDDKSPDCDDQKEQLMRMIITRDEELYALSNKYFTLEDLISIGKRMIGTGLIGGKSVGMLLARAILKKKSDKWKKRLETHDSFFIGSDVFYTYIIKNNCWWERHRLRKTDSLEEILNKSEGIRKTLLEGTFPDEIMAQFREMLNYFGQSPIIVRSSSLLEDAYGNAFSGKYESVFCANQGDPETRLTNFINAVRSVYASTMSRDALSYRSHRGLLKRDEQMALLVQRVSGAFYDKMYFPQIAGVGYSFNPFVWNNKIDPAKGVLRLVFGLGTRAVDRCDDDYTRVVALNAPFLRPESTYDQMRKYTQRIVDVIDLEKNLHTSTDFEKVVMGDIDIPLEIFASRDRELQRRVREMRLSNVFPWMLTFEKLLKDTSFITDIQDMLQTIEQAYEYPVDIEFTANFLSEEDYRINLLQCRPFQVRREIQNIRIPKNIRNEDIVLKTKGPIIGQSTINTLDRVIYVAPEKYGMMSMSDRSSVARLIGELANLRDDITQMIVGPGRWGTSMPTLGIPVTFNEIKNVSIICELDKMHKGLTPELSLGTHFFNDLVEMDIVYMAAFLGKAGYFINEALLKKAPNKLTELVPSADLWSESVRVVDICDLQGKPTAYVNIKAIKQEGMIFLSKK